MTTATKEDKVLRNEPNQNCIKPKWGKFKNTSKEHKSRHKSTERHMFLERTTQDHEDTDSTLICKINVIQIKISTGFLFFSGTKQPGFQVQMEK